MKTLIVDIPIPFKVNKRLESLIKEYGESNVKNALGDMFQYEVIRVLGDIYSECIEPTDAELDELEEILLE